MEDSSPPPLREILEGEFQKVPKRRVKRKKRAQIARGYAHHDDPSDI